MKRLALCLSLLCLLLIVIAADKTYQISGFVGTSTARATSNVQLELINEQTRIAAAEAGPSKETTRVA
jgi:hypothetical protein